MEDRYAVTPNRIACLAEMLGRPTLHIQRFVEQVVFIPSGGQQWTRTLQIRIPETALPPQRCWRIVSLGQFARRRFPDFFVTDADDMRINLLTRQQHGEALAGATIVRHVNSLQDDKRHLIEHDPHVRSLFDDLYKNLLSFSTTAGETAGNYETDLVAMFGHLLESLDITTDRLERLKDFAQDCRGAAGATRYLCWVEAKRNEVINLQVAYSVRDPLHDIENESVRAILGKFKDGASRDGHLRKKTWAEWYRDFGIAPHNYEFNIPGSQHMGSYYFTVAPPPGTVIPYLDWEIDNSIDDTEIDCALASAHIHGDGDTSVASNARGGKVRAYLRCTQHYHKQIVGSTILNVLLVYFVAKGRLPGKVGESTQSFLIVVPSVLIGYLVQQQRHYYAHALRRQRGVLWAYLAISVLFIVGIVFSRYDPALGSRSLGRPTEIIAWLLMLTSAGVFAWYLPLGHTYERITKYLTDKKHKNAPGGQGNAEKWISYQEAIHQYSNWVVRFILLMMIGMAFYMHDLWDQPLKRIPSPKPVAFHHIHMLGLLSVMSLPSQECESCDLDLRFVPTGKSK
jgi:hypothetical protein